MVDCGLAAFGRPIAVSCRSFRTQGRAAKGRFLVESEPAALRLRTEFDGRSFTNDRERALMGERADAAPVAGERLD